MIKLILFIIFLASCSCGDEVPTGNFGVQEVFPNSMASITDCTSNGVFQRQGEYVCAICKDDNGQPIVGKVISSVGDRELCVENCNVCN